MSKAFNLALLANNVNASGLLDGGAVNGPVANATTADTATTATTASSTPVLLTTNFSILEVGGKLVFKYGTTVIASMDSTGSITSADNVTAYGTP
jgi:hypothetical protein